MKIKKIIGIMTLSVMLIGISSCGNNVKENIYYTVNFESNGGSEVKSILVDDIVTKPEDPTREGFIFEGWYLDSEFTISFDFSKGIDSNIILYAKWK